MGWYAGMASGIPLNLRSPCLLQRQLAGTHSFNSFATSRSSRKPEILAFTFVQPARPNLSCLIRDNHLTSVPVVSVL